VVCVIATFSAVHTAAYEPTCPPLPKLTVQDIITNTDIPALDIQRKFAIKQAL